MFSASLVVFALNVLYLKCSIHLPAAITTVNKAVYTAESVACDWAEAVMRKLPEER